MPRRRMLNPDGSPTELAKAEIIRVITRWRRHQGPRPTLRSRCWLCGKEEELAVPECRHAVPDFRLADAMLRRSMTDRQFARVLRLHVDLMLVGKDGPVLAVALSPVKARGRILESIGLRWVQLDPAQVIQEPRRWLGIKGSWECQKCSKTSGNTIS